MPDLVRLTEKASAAAAAAGHVLRAESLVAEQLAQLPAGAPAADRARLLVARAEAALLSESSTDVAALTGDAVGLVDAEPPTALRSRAVAVHATALAATRRDDEALRWAEEGLATPPDVRVGEVTTLLQTVLARVTERAGDPAASERMLRRALEDGPDDLARLRVRYQLGWVELEGGHLEQALATFRQAAQRAGELGRPYAPTGADSRVLAGLVAYQLGHWDLAAELASPGGEPPPPLAAAGLAAVSLAVRAGRGQAAGWLPLMARVRPQWTTDGMVGIHSTAAAIDLHGDAGDLDAALAVYDDLVACIGAVWGTRDFQAHIRLAGLLLGQVAAAAPTADAERRARAAAAQRPAGRGGGPRPGHGPAPGARPGEPGLAGPGGRRAAAACGRPPGWRWTPTELVGAWEAAVDRSSTATGSPSSWPAAAPGWPPRSGGRVGAEDALAVARAAQDVAAGLGAAPLLAELRPWSGGAAARRC